MSRKPLNYYELQKEWNPKDLPYYLSEYTKNELRDLLLLLKQGRISFDDKKGDSQ